MKQNYSKIIVLTIVGFSIGCGSQAGQTTRNDKPPAEVERRQKDLEQAKSKGQALEAELKAMQIPDLAKRLEEDSRKGLEPFNSVAFREARGRGERAGADLAAQVKNADRSSFLTLMAVHKTNKQEYDKLDVKLRVSILTDALKNSKQFNTWGMPHLYWEDSAKALIEAGTAAEEPLRALLSDNRDAPVWGSEEVMEYQRYKYRVKDYAWALLLAIKNQKVEIPPEPARRDQLIQELSGQ